MINEIISSIGILPSIAHVISQYSPIDIQIIINSYFSIFKKQNDIIRFDAFIHSNHALLIAVCDAQKTEIIRIPNYQLSAECTIVNEENNEWINQIVFNQEIQDRTIIHEHFDTLSIAQRFLFPNGKMIQNDGDNHIIDVWQHNTAANAHHFVSRRLSNNFAEILKVSRNKTERLFHFVFPDTYIVNRPCCFIVDGHQCAFLVYHTYSFENNDCSLGLRCCHVDGEVYDIEIPLCVLNETYSKTLSVDKIYIMAINQKYCFHHRQSGKYLLFMDLTYRLRNLSGKKRNAMKFISSVFVWQFEVDWKEKSAQNIAVSGIKIDMSLSGISRYRLVCFDDENGAMLIHERDTSNFMMKRLSDVIQEWKYYLH